jgi:NADH-quinone oxidoreductase subunit L
VGDAGFLLGVMTMFLALGSVRFLDVDARLATGGAVSLGVLNAMALLLFLGACGKSAQFPLHVWLPDAMEGPTPVSALIHAATMVTAGVYMVARSHALFSLALDASQVVAVVGCFTAILAASIALVQNDIKKVLAYSTVSQLGYMFLALGVGAYWVAIFHVFTHAFFKALLFLGAGSVIHAVGGEQDMQRMGGLRSKLPVTHNTMLVATLAITGIPGFAGFFSKDEILAQVYGAAHGSKLLYAVGLLTALMTAFYMWRMMYLTFYGPSRIDEKTHVHESPPVMTVPLVILAAGSVLAGWIGVPPAWTWFGDSFRAFEHWLEPLFGHHELHHVPEWTLMVLSVGVAVLGWWIASRYYHVEWTGPLANAMRRLWFIDEFYNRVFVRGLAQAGGLLAGQFDARIVDGGVNGAGWLTRFTSQLSIWWDTWIVDGLVRAAGVLARAASWPVRWAHTGLVQSYALVFVLGVLVMLGFYVIR